MGVYSLFLQVLDLGPRLPPCHLGLVVFRPGPEPCAESRGAPTAGESPLSEASVPLFVEWPLEGGWISSSLHLELFMPPCVSPALPHLSLLPPHTRATAELTLEPSGWLWAPVRGCHPSDFPRGAAHPAPQARAGATGTPERCAPLLRSGRASRSPGLGAFAPEQLQTRAATASGPVSGPGQPVETLPTLFSRSSVCSGAPPRPLGASASDPCHSLGGRPVGRL